MSTAELLYSLDLRINEVKLDGRWYSRCTDGTWQNIDETDNEGNIRFVTIPRP